MQHSIHQIYSNFLCDNMNPSLKQAEAMPKLKLKFCNHYKYYCGVIKVTEIELYQMEHLQYNHPIHPIYSNFLCDNMNPELKQAEAVSKEKQKFFFVTGSMLFSFSLLSKVFSA